MAPASASVSEFTAIEQIALLCPIQSANPASVIVRRRQQKALRMHAPIHITYQGVLPSDAIEGCIHQEWESLRDIGAPITSSYVTVAEPRAKHFSGDPCRLRVHLTVEGCSDINVNHDPGPGRRHDAMELAVRDAFRIVRRRLEDSLRRRQALL